MSKHIWIAAFSGLAVAFGATWASAGGGTIDKVTGNMSIEVNVRFPPAQSDLDQLKQQMEIAKTMLCDATDGQIKLRKVTITSGDGTLENGDIWWFPNQARPFSPGPDGHIHMFGTGQFSSINGITLGHELGHAFLGIGDEYGEQRRNGGCGIGPSFDADVRMDEVWHSIMQGPSQVCRDASGRDHSQMRPGEWGAVQCLELGTGTGCPAGTTCQALLSSELGVTLNHDQRRADNPGGMCPSPRPARILTLAAKLDPSAVFGPCGNGTVDAGTGEECDGTATRDCSTFGLVPSGTGSAAACSSCVWNTAFCNRASACGNGTLDPNEQCDPASTTPRPTCASLGGSPFDLATVPCSSSCADDTSVCQPRGLPIICGNGNVDLGEQCDGTNLNGQTCTSLGFNGGGSLSCRGCWLDTRSCIRLAGDCGNGSIDSGEECDGGALGGASCTSLGFAGGTLTCRSNCTFDKGSCDLGAIDRFNATSFDTAAASDGNSNNDPKYEVFDAIGRIEGKFGQFLGESNHGLRVYAQRFNSRHWTLIFAADAGEYRGTEGQFKEIGRYNLEFIDDPANPNRDILSRINGTAVGGARPTLILGGTSANTYGALTNGAHGQTAGTGPFTAMGDGTVAAAVTLELRLDGMIVQRFENEFGNFFSTSIFFYTSGATFGEPGAVDEAQLGICTDPQVCLHGWNRSTGRFETTDASLGALRASQPIKADWTQMDEFILKRFGFDLTVPEFPTANPPSNADCGGPIDFPATNLQAPDEIILVLDRSGSMDAPTNNFGAEGEKRIEFAQAAARAFTDLQAVRAAGGSTAKTGLIGFDDIAEEFVGLQQIVGSGAGAGQITSTDFKAQINALTPRNLTAIGTAMRVAGEKLSTTAGPLKAVMLLSDGENNRPTDGTDVPAQEAQKLRDRGIQIYTVPVGIAADRILMGQIADVSGGRMYDAPVGDELPAIYMEMFARSQGDSPVLERRASAVAKSTPPPTLTSQEPEVLAADPLPESETFDIPVEVGAQRLNVMLSARNAAVTDWNPLIALRDPTGAIVRTETSGENFVDPFYQILTVPNPALGTWKLTVSARNSSSELSYIMAHVRNPGPRCFASATPRVAQNGTTVEVSATASFGVALGSGVTFTGTMRRPDGSEVTLNFAPTSDSPTHKAVVDPSSFIGRGVYDVVIRCSAGTEARLHQGESLFDDQPFQSRDPVDPFVRETRAAFFLDSSTRPPLPPGADCDGDGIPNSVEGDVDTDGDGAPDQCDDDADADDMPDRDEGTGDPDFDSIPNFRDRDSDNDGIIDGADPEPLVPNAQWPTFKRDAARGGRAIVNGPGTGTLAWSFDAGHLDVSSSPAVGADGTVYVGSDSDRLYALNPNGSVKWSFKTGADVKSSPAIGANGRVYVGSEDDKLYALNAQTGALVWSVHLGNDVKSSPAIAPDGTVYVGSDSDRLYAISPAGAVLWSFNTGGNVYSSPAIGPDGTVYVGSDSNSVYALTPQGALRWSRQTGGDVRSTPVVSPSGTTIYVGSDDDKVYALSAATGAVNWTFDTGLNVVSSPAIGQDGTIYFGSLNERVYALNPNGTLRWSFETDGAIHSSPAIGANGTVYVGSDDDRIYAFNGQTGAVVWSFETDGNVKSSPAIAADGSLYVGSEDDHLYRIGGTQTLGLSTSMRAPGSGSASTGPDIEQHGSCACEVTGGTRNTLWLPAALFAVAGLGVYRRRRRAVRRSTVLP